MNIVVNSQALAQELRLLNKIAPAKAPVPILSYIQFTAADTLSMYATDLELGLQTRCQAEIRLPGVTALPAARLLAMVEQFPNADVSMALTGTNVEIVCGAFKSRLQTLPNTDFPQIPELSGPSYPLNAPQLRGLIELTRYAVTDKAGRYFMQGGLLTLAGELAAMITTDGKRLALATMPRIGPDVQAILPSKTLDILAMQPDQGDIELTVGDRHLFFLTSGRMIISRKLDGQFPSYERIIPKENPNKAVIDRFALAAALRRVGLIAAEDTQSTTFEFGPNTLMISATSANVGAASEQLLITYDGEFPLKVNMSWKSVLDMLDVAKGLTVTLALKDAVTPVLLMDGDYHLAVVMPMA